MADVIDRFEHRIMELEQSLEGYREFVAALVSRKASGTKPGMERLVQRIKEAKAPSQFKRLLLEIPAIDGGAPTGVDSGGAEELLVAFAKGIALLGDHEDPLVSKLNQAIGDGFETIPPNEIDPLVESLERFFSAKREEFSLVGEERGELKNLVASLIDHLHSLGTVNTTFQTKIDSYITGMEAAIDFEDIQTLKDAALYEMRNARQASAGMIETVASAGGRLEAARRRITELEQSLDKARKERWTDALTGVFNRGFFDKALLARLKEADVLKQSLCLIMLDIDHFKTFNDSYGHRAGDQVLKTVARLATNAIRPGDIFCRYGGEEFVAILPNTKGEEGFGLAEDIRKAVREHEFIHKDQLLLVTVSLGVSSRKGGERDAVWLIEAADAALYKAKKDGRDRVRVGGEN